MLDLVRRSLVGSLLFACAFPFLSQAQTNEGVIAGTVTDQSGALVAGAQVTAVSQETKAPFSATTGEDGAFRFPSVPIGLYDLTVKHAGFSTVNQTGVRVQIANVTTVPITLKVGEATETVTVEADATHIETESSDIGTVISSRQVIELPLALGGVGALRSPEAFMFLAPGTTGPGTANSNNGVFISKIGGGQEFGNEILLDGASIVRTENAGSFDEAAPSVEAISEFKVFTSTIPAEYGRMDGGVETFTTKSGTNSFHGTVYDLLQNADVNANSWFNNGYAAQCATGDTACRAPYARPVDTKNDYGINLGGPVWIPKVYNGRNKTFFFFNWEQYRQTIGGTFQSIVPTAAERAGNFSSILTNNVVGTNPCTGQPVYSGEIFDPNSTTTGPGGLECRTPFLNNSIPTARISQISQNFLNYFPLPNIATQPSGINYNLSSSTPLENTTYTLRIDENLSDKSKFFAMYDTRDNNRYSSGIYQLPPPADPNGWNQNFVTHYGRAGWDYIFSPTVYNHLNLGYNRTNSQNYTTGALQAISGNFSWTQKLGIAGLSGTEFPIVSVGEGVPNLGRANDDANVDQGERVNDQVTVVRGKHSFIFGGDFRSQLYATYGNDTDTGVYNFGRNQTAATESTNATSGNGIASFLLGDVADGNALVQAHVPRWNFQYYGIFAQDDWKVTNHLTLNLGLRWDVDVPRAQAYNDTSNLSLTTPNPGAGGLPGAMVFGTNCHCNTRWADTKWHDVGPRLGFAYNPNGGRTVVRGGYGVIYSPLQYTDFGGSQVQGFSATPNFFNSDNFTPAFNWANGFPSFPAPPFTSPTIENGSNPDYIAPQFGQPGIIQSWSFQIQEQVSKNMVATLGYVGQHAQNLRSNIQNINNITQNNFALGTGLQQNIVGNTVGVPLPYAGFTGQVQQALRPFPQYGYIFTDTLQNVGMSSYDSLQASLERRFSAGLSLQSSFTWAKTLTDADSLLPDVSTGGSAQIQNPYGLGQEKALSTQDVPYTFTAAFLYELPFGKNKPFAKSRFASAVLGGWQLGGVLRYQSGTPLSFGCAVGIPGWDNCIRFNRASSPLLSAGATSGHFNPFTERYFTPVCSYVGQAGCAFADPNTELVSANSTESVQQARGGAYSLGNLPRTTPDAFGPHYYNEDFSIIRNFHLFESASIQIKGELLNAFNRHIFAIANTIDAGPYDPNFGVVNSTIDSPRIVQFTARINF